MVWIYYSVVSLIGLAYLGILQDSMLKLLSTRTLASPFGIFSTSIALFCCDKIYQGITVSLYFICQTEKLMWKHYFQKTQGLIFVVYSNERDCRRQQ